MPFTNKWTRKAPSLPVSRGERLALPVRAGDHDNIAIWVLDPYLAVAGRRIDVRLEKHLCTQGTGTLHGSIEVIDLEPQKNPVPRPSGLPIDKVWVVVFVPGVKLKDERTAAKNPVVDMVMVAVHYLGCALCR